MSDREYFKLPNLCPACGSPVSVEGDFLYCRSKSCPVQLTGAIKVWVKRLGLLHWGDSLIEALTDPETPRVNSVADLYRLSVEDISDCCSGMKVAQKCFEILQSNKSMTLDTMLGSLNIPNLATSTAADMVSAGFDTIEKVLNTTVDTLIKVPNIGPITANSIFNGLQEKREIILDLAKVLDIKTNSGPLVGKTFCITGTTSKPRKTLEKIITDNGGTAKSSVGVGLNYLITNDSDTGSSKMKNAKKHGTTIISEIDFYQMIGISS